MSDLCVRPDDDNAWEDADLVLRCCAGSKMVVAPLTRGDLLLAQEVLQIVCGHLHVCADKEVLDASLL